MTLTPWQRTNILAALNCLKDIGRLGHNQQATSLAQGLMEVLEPSRRTIRLQREAAQAAAESARAGRERRARERRANQDRRRAQMAFEGVDRRRGGDRRTGERRGSLR